MEEYLNEMSNPNDYFNIFEVEKVLFTRAINFICKITSPISLMQLTQNIIKIF